MSNVQLSALLLFGILALVILLFLILRRGRAHGSGAGHHHRVSRMDSFLGQDFEVDPRVLRFSGGLQIDGVVRLKLEAFPSVPSLVLVSEKARVEGDIRAEDAIIAGTVVGSIHAGNSVELKPSARVNGNIECRELVRAGKARVTGQVKVRNKH